MTELLFLIATALNIVCALYLLRRAGEYREASETLHAAALTLSVVVGEMEETVKHD